PARCSSERSKTLRARHRSSTRSSISGNETWLGTSRKRKSSMSGHDTQAMRSGTAEALLAIHVTPGARRPGITGYRDGILRVAVKAPPERGKATDEAVALVAAWLR